MTLRIGVDLGGTKIEAVVVAVGEEPDVVARKRVATERGRGYEHILETTRALVLEVERAAGKSGLPLGVAMPGAVTRAGLVKNSNTTCLNGRAFRQDLSGALERPISFANDANCFALAEARWGSARGARIAFGVIMGTGVGGGLVIDGKAWEGAQGIAGEWGHLPLEPQNGPECYCGRRGCVETYLSGPAIERVYRERAGAGAGAGAGAALGLREIVAEAKRGERVAKDLLDERVDIFGRALAMVIDIVDPDVVVLGGGVSNVDLFTSQGARAVARWVFNDVLETSIVRNSLGDSAGVLGAALL